MGFGMTLQTSNGELLLTLARPWNRIHQSLLMEAHALHYALSWCRSHSIYLDCITSDCKVLVDYICNNDTHNLHFNKFVYEIQSNKLAKKALGLYQEAL
ncbi:hypothetical protein F8388_019816 [Cannabis sativa]|uniref:RNase H type-1 domain-containing protein n=1 Tax=Cannabis sativa TaxID=3483 RepID=A0A7J6HPL4_CANSA|nr:hypothetical protein F8388_019816 [Cannabis sativa]